MEQEILKFINEHITALNLNFIEIIHMQCEALSHATSNVVVVGGLLSGKGASLLRKLTTASRA